jgi:outer membrane protein insertion porin family
MKLALSILASSLLIAGAAQAAQNDTDKPATAPADTRAGTTQKESPPAFYQDLDKIDDVNPYVIKGVVVEGNKLIPRAQIKAVIKTKPGDFYHKKDMEKDIKAIYNLGYFDGKDLHVEAQTTAAGMLINIHVKENPFLKSITFSGNHILPTSQLQELFKEQLQKPRSNTQFGASLKSIEDSYKKQGYLLARATTSKDDPEGTVPVIIDEGIVKEIKITCPTDEQKQLIQDTLTLKVGSPYNEKQLATDLRTAFKSGKFEDIQREVLADKDKAGGFIVSIKSVQKKQRTKANEGLRASVERGPSQTCPAGFKSPYSFTNV